MYCNKINKINKKYKNLLKYLNNTISYISNYKTIFFLITSNLFKFFLVFEILKEKFYCLF